MRDILQQIFRQFHKLHALSTLSFKLGFALMIVFYIIALAAKLYAPYASEYFQVLAVYRGCLETAPAFLAVGVCVGLLGDLILRNGKADDDSSDQNE